MNPREFLTKDKSADFQGFICSYFPRLLKDQEPLVRSNTVAALLYLHGLPTDGERAWSELMELKRKGLPQIRVAPRDTLQVRIMSQTLADRDAAIGELLAAIGFRPLREGNGSVG